MKEFPLKYVMPSVQQVYQLANQILNKQNTYASTSMLVSLSSKIVWFWHSVADHMHQFFSHVFSRYKMNLDGTSF